VVVGDSNATITQYAKQHPGGCDLISIDGSHEPPQPFYDIVNFRGAAHPRPETQVLLDDMNQLKGELDRAVQEKVAVEWECLRGEIREYRWFEVFSFRLFTGFWNRLQLPGFNFCRLMAFSLHAICHSQTLTRSLPVSRSGTIMAESSSAPPSIGFEYWTWFSLAMMICRHVARAIGGVGPLHCKFVIYQESCLQSDPHSTPMAQTKPSIRTRCGEALLQSLRRESLLYITVHPTSCRMSSGERPVELGAKPMNFAVTQPTVSSQLQSLV
jgi:hypothetical protein